MKTNLRILAVAAGIMVLGFSCSKDKKDEGVPFSQKTVEENKQVVENSAIELAQTMDEMKDIETVDAAVSLGNLLDQADPFSDGSVKSSKVRMVIDGVASLKQGRNTVHKLFNAMKASGELEEDPQSIHDVWDELVGIYTWNPGANDWNKVTSSDKIQFQFPSTEGGVSNDAKLTIYNYAGVVIANPIDEDYTGDLPVSLNMKLEVGSSTLMTYTFAAQYNSEGVPSSVATDLTIEDFKFSIDLTNNSTQISGNYKFTHNNATIMEIGGGINGDFTQENIDANTETVTDTWTWWDYQYNPVSGQYEYVEITETEEHTEVNAEEIIQRANAKFQVMNIALVGTVNIKAMVNETDALYPENYWEDPDFDEQATKEKEAAIMNKYLAIYAMDVKAKQKIAQAEAYMVADEYYPGEFDYYVDMRLKFGDGSFADMQTYFESGFGDFIAEINSMISELNGKYDWAIEPIEY
ncbi:MAG: hypothetical protein U0T82_05950 [Bacteroidales bacterium]